MTIQDFLNTYDFPTEEVGLIKNAVAYWESIHLGQKVNITVKEEITNGGALYTKGPPNLGITIKTGSGGRFPVINIGGNRYTFAQYDNKLGPVHEMGHAVLELLGIGKYETDELRIAILAKATKQANGDMKLLRRMLLGIENGWSTPEQVAYAKESTASFENLYNLQRNFRNMTGLSNNPEVQRRGYRYIGEWETSQTSTLPNRKSLLEDGKNVGLLGNQLNNEFIGGEGSDYIDGANGDDILYGDGFDTSETDKNGNTLETVDDDILFSDEGKKDIIIGGKGKDKLHVETTRRNYAPAVESPLL